jgi:DNA-binding transcriptional regulator PaaX
VVLYDIDAKAKTKQQGIRKALKVLGFIQLQRSVYIIPYDCQEQVSFIRTFFGLGTTIRYMEVSILEDDELFRRHFGL